MDIKTKLKSVIIFSYITLGLLIVLPTVGCLFDVIFSKHADSLLTIIVGSIFSIGGLIVVWTIISLYAPIALITNFSVFIQTISVENVLFLITGLLNYIALILFFYSFIHVKEELKNNPSLQKIKIHFKIIRGVYIGFIILFILFLTLTGGSIMG